MTTATVAGDGAGLPAQRLRMTPPLLPAMSAAQVARHFAELSRRDALAGGCGVFALPPQWVSRHPAAPDDVSQGMLACLFELQTLLRDTSGAAAVSLAPQSELHAEFACMAMIRAYHDSRGDLDRSDVLAAAPVREVHVEAAAMCGYTLREIACNADGEMDASAMKAAAGPRTAALLSAHADAAGNAIASAAGALLLGGIEYGGSIADRDVIGIHLPPDSVNSMDSLDSDASLWAVGVSRRLMHFVPLPVMAHVKEVYRVLGEKDLPLSIGRFAVNSDAGGARLRAYLRAHLQHLHRDRGTGSNTL